jgi:hypothetical protein
MAFMVKDVASAGVARSAVVGRPIRRSHLRFAASAAPKLGQDR